jgi:hypothetical protein
VDASNPLPERFDPITLEPVVSPAISPYGHVMGAATWKVRLPITLSSHKRLHACLAVWQHRQTCYQGHMFTSRAAVQCSL